MTASAATTRMYVCSLETDVLRLLTELWRFDISPAKPFKLLTVVCIWVTSFVSVVMLEVMELILDAMVLTVLESVVREVPRPCTLVFTVPSVELTEPRAVLIELRVEVRPATAVLIAEMFLPRPPTEEVTADVIAAIPLALATWLFTVNAV
jgi:hypothetical protein